MILKRLYVLLMCVLGSILMVVLLVFISSRANQHRNSFIRLLPSNKITPGNILSLKNKGWYIAGTEKHLIYFGNLYAPDQILTLNVNLKDSVVLKLKFSQDVSLFKGCFSLIENGSIYILDGNQPALLSGNFDSLNLKHAAKPPYFTQGIHTNGNSFILRVVQNGGNRLVKYKTDSVGFKLSRNLLEKQVDGIFCTDGNLIKVPNSNKVIYVYYYRNQFICADDNLKLLYKGKTIDTVSRAQIKVAYIKSQNQTTLASPPLYVNKQSAANEKYLFIRSGLVADNEVVNTLEKASPIDVYSVKDGKYQFSFYLPDFRGNKVHDFKVYGQSLYALYDHYLYQYQLNF